MQCNLSFLVCVDAMFAYKNNNNTASSKPGELARARVWGFFTGHRSTKVSLASERRNCMHYVECETLLKLVPRVIAEMSVDIMIYRFYRLNRELLFPLGRTFSSWFIQVEKLATTRPEPTPMYVCLFRGSTFWPTSWGVIRYFRGRIQGCTAKDITILWTTFTVYLRYQPGSSRKRI